MAAANEISVNAAVAADLSELNDIFILKEERKNCSKGFSRCFALLRTEFAEFPSTPRRIVSRR